MDVHSRNIRSALQQANKRPVHFSGQWNLPQDLVKVFYKKGSIYGCISFPSPTLEDLESLSQACAPATFGRNQEDILDDSYRKAGKLDRSDFAINLTGSQNDLLVSAASLLNDKTLNSEAIEVELYKLNVYGPGSFFKAHKDTPRGENMFGSIVVVLPTKFEGGSLVLRHNSEEWTYDPAKEFAATLTGANQSDTVPVSWVTFYSDVEHEVLPVTSGYRVTLTYNLYKKKLPAAPAIPSSFDFISFKSALQQTLSDKSFVPEGGYLGFNLEHLYPVNAESNFKEIGESYLKGRDAALMSVFKDLGINGSVKAIYQLDDYYEDRIMVPEIADLSGWGEMEYSDLQRELKSMGGIIFFPVFWCSRKPQPVPSKDDNAELPVIHWMTPLTETNEIESPYISYGNEACLAHLYGNLSLIFEIPAAKDR